MKALLYGGWVVVLAMAGLVYVRSAKTQEAGHVSDKERLIGAWYLEHIDSPEPKSKPSDIPQPKGMLIYTRDGHMSVQVMYRNAQTESGAAPVQYAQGGYEASFGRFEIDGAHTFTFHVEGALVRTFISKDLPRLYGFAGNQLIVKPVNPNEHWRVAWEHY